MLIWGHACKILDRKSGFSFIEWSKIHIEKLEACCDVCFFFFSTGQHQKKMQNRVKWTCCGKWKALQVLILYVYLHCSRMCICNMCVCVLGVYFLIHASLQNNLMTLDPFQYTAITPLPHSHVDYTHTLNRLGCVWGIWEGGAAFVKIHTFWRIWYASTYHALPLGFYNRNRFRHKDTTDNIAYNQMMIGQSMPHAHTLLSTSTIY